MKKKFTKQPKVSIRCSTQLSGMSEADLLELADRFVLSALEWDGDSRAYEIHTPEQAAVAGLQRMKISFEDAIDYDELEDWLDYHRLPSDFQCTRENANFLKPYFQKAAQKYDFSSPYDDEDVWG